MLVTVGTAATPKFWSLQPPAPAPRAGGAGGASAQTRAAFRRAAGADRGGANARAWALPPAKLGRTGAGAEPPKSLSAVAFGGAAFSSPSGVPWGLTLIGGGGAPAGGRRRRSAA